MLIFVRAMLCMHPADIPALAYAMMLQAVKLTFEGNKEVLVPVKESTKEENVQYMASLYDRCQETRAKTKQTLEEKWLQPLIKPKQAAAK